jgi:intracellular septation protein
MKPIIEFFPIVIFFAAYKFYGIYIATEVIMAATVVELLIYWLIYRKIESMHKMKLGLILSMGGLTLYLHDEQFIKWKATIFEWIFGVIILGSQFFGSKTFIQKILENALELPTAVWKKLNMITAMFFFALGFLNIYVMYNYSTDDWVNFKTFAVPVLMIVFFSILLGVASYKQAPTSEPKK